jgi:hypothetical protein
MPALRGFTGLVGSLLSMPGRLVPASLGGIPGINPVFTISLAPPAWTVSDALITGWAATLAPSAWQVSEAP